MNHESQCKMMHAPSSNRPFQLPVFVLSKMLCFLLIIQPAFALPKSPFLGLKGDSAPGDSLLQPAQIESQASEFLLTSKPFLSSPYELQLNGLNNVALFHGFHCDGFCMLALTYIILGTPILLSFLIIGQASGNDAWRNASNIGLYPWLVVPPAYLGFELIDDAYQYPENYEVDDLLMTLSFVGTASGLILATVGQATDNHRMRDTGNFTYLGGVLSYLLAMVAF